MSHQVLAAQLNHIEVAIAKVLPVSQKRGKHAIGVLGGEREHERPVQQPAGLVEHAHGTFGEPCADHVLDLANGRQLGALARLLELDLAGKQAPENLRDELVLRVRLGAQNLLQDEQVVVRVYYSKPSW